MLQPPATSRLSRLARERPLATFFVLAYVWSWSFFLPMVVAGAIRPPLIVAATFGPSLAAVVTHRLATGHWGAFRFVTTWPRAILGTAAGCGLTLVAYVVVPGLIAGDPRQLQWGILASVGVYDASTLLGGPLGEEPGWRGYALPRLEQRFGPLTGSLVIALAWVGWHLPLFLVPGWTTSTLPAYVLLLGGISVILTFAANIAGFGVIAAIATHAAFNTASRFLEGLFVASEPRVHMSFEMLLALSGLATAVVLTVVTRGRLALVKGWAGPASRGVA